jgi:hypothetical protein
LLERSANGFPEPVLTLMNGGERGSQRSELTNHLRVDESISITSHA